MSESRRQVLRIPTEQTGRVLVRDEMRVFDRPIPVKVNILNASPDGVGVEIKGKIPRLAQDTAVVVEVQLNSVKISLPGKLAWHQVDDDEKTVTAGVRLQLQIADARTRELFIGWVVQNARSEGLLEAFQRSVMGN